MIIEGLVIALPILAAYVGYNERDKFLMREQIKKQTEALHAVDVKSEVTRANHIEVRRDIKRIEDKIDKLLDKLNLL